MKMTENSVVSLRSMPFWGVANPLSDPFGGPVLEKIDPAQTARLLAEAKNDGLIEATGFHDDDVVPWDPEHPEDDLDPKSGTYAKLREIKEILDDAGVLMNSAVCSLHGNRIFRNGWQYPRCFGEQVMEPQPAYPVTLKMRSTSPLRVRMDGRETVLAPKGRFVEIPVVMDSMWKFLRIKPAASAGSGR